MGRPEAHADQNYAGASVIWPVAADPNRMIRSGRATVRTRRTTSSSSVSSTVIQFHHTQSYHRLHEDFGLVDFGFGLHDTRVRPQRWVSERERRCRTLTGPAELPPGKGKLTPNGSLTMYMTVRANTDQVEERSTRLDPVQSRVLVSRNCLVGMRAVGW